MKKLIKTSFALACISATATAFSQTESAIKDEIIVTAKNEQTTENVLQTVHTFDLRQIEAAQAKDIPALIDEVAGISFRDSGGRGSTTSVFLRGASNAQIIVLIDGVRVGSATLGSAALNAYPIEAIARIEVIKGPFSGIYGADAAAGVIQLFTKKGGDGRGTVRATTGSNALRELGLSLSAGDERNSIHLSANSEATDGIDRTSILSGNNDDVDGFEETAFSLGGKISLGDATSIHLNVLATDSTVDFDNTFGTDPGLMTESKTLSSALNVSTRLTDSINWVTTLGVNEDQSITNGAFPSDLTTERNSLGTELSISLGEHTIFSSGLDYYEESIESPTTTFPVTDRDNTGAFVQLTSGVGAFSAAASLRYDDNSAYGSNTNGNLALGYDINDKLNATVSYGSAFAAPSFNFLYFPFFGNPDILPEESDSIELKLAGNTDTLSWYIAAYKTDFENLFSFNPSTFLAANIGAAELKGLEANVKTKFANWDIAVNADLLSATNVDTGVELDDRAEKTLAMSASKAFGDLYLRFNLKLESERFDNSGTKLPSYGLFDISAEYAINDNLDVLANIDNLFDKDYTVNLIGSNDRYNTEGRQAKLSVRYRF